MSTYHPFSYAYLLITVILDKTKDLRTDPVKDLPKEVDYKKYLREVLAELKSEKDQDRTFDIEATKWQYTHGVRDENAISP